MSNSRGPQSPSVEESAFRARVEARLEDFLGTQRTSLNTISPESLPLVENIAALCRGGKRLRPLFTYWGARAAGADADRAQEQDIVTLGAAQELFQAAALIHDDVLDHSDTRRGGPSVHRRFESLHREHGWDLDPGEFGIAGAILAGDLALTWSEQLFAQASPAPAARRIFEDLRTQVMAGQYLDVLEEQVGARRTPDEALEAARVVVRHKSAAYSVVNPILLGAAQAGADEDLRARLAAFARPLGEAFQLRDDELGVFGDPAITGKPAGDDLREGKRTALVALTLRQATGAVKEELQAALGNPELGDADVDRIRTAMRDSGAATLHEDLIDSLVAEADRALDAARVPDDAREGLRSMAAAAVARRT